MLNNLPTLDLHGEYRESAEIRRIAPTVSI